jgi:WD40 repeat protein
MTHCDNKIRLWEAATGKLIGVPFPIGAHLDQSAAVVFSPDGHWLLSPGRGNNAQLWDAATGLSKGSALTHASPVRGVAFSPDGRRILSGSGKTAQLWDAAGNPIGEPISHRGTVASVAFSPDNRMILTTCLDGTAQRWDLATRKPVGRGFQSPVGAQGDSRFSPDGRTVLMVHGDGKSRFGDTVSGRPLGVAVRHSGTMSLAAFSPDGRSVLLRDPDERTLRLWEVPVPLEGEVERIVSWTEVITGMELNAEGAAHVLDAGSWHERRHRLDELGGPPAGATREHRQRSSSDQPILPALAHAQKAAAGERNKGGR